MKLQTLLEELEGQKSRKWDEKAPAERLEMVLSGGRPRLVVNGKKEPLLITAPCQDQIAERLEIPVKYYRKMAEETPNLLTENVNTWLRMSDKDLFLRGLGESVRAFLSDRYRVIDHLDILYCALNELQAHKAEIEECHLSETEMNVKVKSGQLSDFVRHRNDQIVGGFLIVNSETGHKALRLEPRIFRVLCSNGMIMENMKTRQVHLGNGDDDFDEVVYLSLRRSITELFGRFGEIVQSLRESTEIKVRTPRNVIANLVEHYRLSEDQKENILMAFGAEPESDQYGIANAVTQAAQRENSWEKSVELERIGGRLITLPSEEFRLLDK